MAAPLSRRVAPPRSAALRRVSGAPRRFPGDGTPRGAGTAPGDQGPHRRKDGETRAGDRAAPGGGERSGPPARSTARLLRDRQSQRDALPARPVRPGRDRAEQAHRPGEDDQPGAAADLAVLDSRLRGRRGWALEPGGGPPRHRRARFCRTEGVVGDRAGVAGAGGSPLPRPPALRGARARSRARLDRPGGEAQPPGPGGAPAAARCCRGLWSDARSGRASLAAPPARAESGCARGAAGRSGSRVRQGLRAVELLSGRSFRGRTSTPWRRRWGEALRLRRGSCR